MTKTKIAVISALGVAAIVAPIVLEKQNARLREENAALQQRAQITEEEKQQLASKRKTEGAEPGQPFDWRALESSDYKQYIANLRAVGCPEQTIREIITADVRRVYRERIAKVRSAAHNPKEYWKKVNWIASTEASLQVQQIENEERAVLRELLGDDAVKDIDVHRDYSNVQLGFLSPEKRDRLYEINHSYSQKFTAI